MTWTANPLFFSRKKPAADAEAAATSPRQAIQQGLQDGFLEPSKSFTGQQIFYLLVPHGFIAAIISGVVNMAIAVGRFSPAPRKTVEFQGAVN
jgi:hypothetical protein